MGFLGGFGSKIAKVSHKISRAPDNNRWLKLAAVSTGPSQFFTDMNRMDRDGHWGSQENWNAAAADMSPLATYFVGNQTDRRGAAINESTTAHLGMTKEDALVNEVRSAYGMDTASNGAALEQNLRQYISALDAKIAKPTNVVSGSEREAAVAGRKQFGAMLAKLVAARGTNAGTMTKAQVAINSLGGRAAASAKHDANRELDTRLATDVSQQNAAAFTRGVSGSSFDQAARAKQVSDYSLGRSGIANSLAEGDRTFRDTLDSQRRTLEDRARTVGQGAIEPAAIAANQANAASAAYSNLTGRSLGQLLATGSDLVQNDQVQRAQGNMGFRGLMGSTPFTQSRSSGGSLTRS